MKCILIRCMQTKIDAIGYLLVTFVLFAPLYIFVIYVVFELIRHGISQIIGSIRFQLRKGPGD